MLSLSNGTIFNDLEWSVTQISRSRHFFDIEYLSKRHEIEPLLL